MATILWYYGSIRVRYQAEGGAGRHKHHQAQENAEHLGFKGCNVLDSQLKTDMKMSLQLALNDPQLYLNAREMEGHWDRSREPTRHDVG